MAGGGEDRDSGCWAGTLFLTVFPELEDAGRSAGLERSVCCPSYSVLHPRTLYSPGDAVLVGGDPLLLLSPPRSVPSARCIVMTVFAQPVPITSLLHSPAPATWPVPFWQLAHNREGHRLGRCLPGRTWDT